MNFCDHCGKTFQQKHPAHVYCTIRCRSAFYSKIAKAKNANYRKNMKYMKKDKYFRLMQINESFLRLKLQIESDNVSEAIRSIIKEVQLV